MNRSYVSDFPFAAYQPCLRYRTYAFRGVEQHEFVIFIIYPSITVPSYPRKVERQKKRRYQKKKKKTVASYSPWSYRLDCTF